MSEIAENSNIRSCSEADRVQGKQCFSKGQNFGLTQFIDLFEGGDVTMESLLKLQLINSILRFNALDQPPE